MDRISSTPSFVHLEHCQDFVHSSLVIDNWMYQSSDAQKMARRGSVPQIVNETTPDIVYSIPTADINFNINEDDLDCPGHTGRGLCSNISSDSLYSSEDDHDLESRARAMSVDEAYLRLDASDDEDHSEPMGVRFALEPLSVDPAEDSDCQSEYELDDAVDTPTGEDSPRPRSGSFFRLERRASFDNGVFGMPDRIVRGELRKETLVRNALTAPGTPADPSTPVGRFLNEDELNLDPEKVFNRIYNLLCAERVTQMTKTYNDIEAVTRLLEEKERDLELAARIGQTLLSKNKELSTRGDALEDQLNHASEKINQLKHDLSMKDELLRFYCQDLQEESSSDTSPPSDGLAGLSKINIEMLQRKVGTLEEENLNLRLESAQLRSTTENYEEKEKKLVEDCLEQLTEVNQQVETFAGELRIKQEECSRQKEEITQLLAQVADLHKRIRQLTIENMDLSEKLQASQESQRQLTKELSIEHDKYDELFEMLEQAQDELRSHRNRNNPRATRHHYLSAALPSATSTMDSLASELQSSLQQEDSEEKEKRPKDWKVFETARAARKAASKSSRESSVRMSTSASSSYKDPNSQTPSNVPSDSESFHSDGYSADMDSMYGSTTELARLGRPGIPGSNDLESALRRLAVRRANEMNERDYHEAHKDPRDTRSEGMSPFRVGDTPDSIMSPASGCSYLGYSQPQTSSHYKLPDKLQIVKPLEGSVTLRHWQRLAQPHLGGLFEQREGVQVRGERKLDLEGEVYTLSDFEEDDEIPECPSRRYADSSTVYTFTNSLVSNPQELHTSFSSSSLSQSVSGTASPRLTSTPKSSSRSNTSSTYTMSLGLAAILEGREVAAARSLIRPVASCPVMPEVSEATITTTTAVSGASTPVSSPSKTSLTSSGSVAAGLGSGLFGKLMNTGYSLLWNKSDSLGSNTDLAGLEAASLSGKATQSPQAEGGKPQQKPTGSQIMPKGGATGVLGAIASFRKNGIL